MSAKILGVIVSGFLVSCSERKETSAASNSDISLEAGVKEEFQPAIKVAVLRDGGSVRISVRGGPEEGGWDLFRAVSDDKNASSRFFSDALWMSNDKEIPLSMAEVLNKMEEIEELIKIDYPDGLSNIRMRRKELNDLSSEQLLAYISDPKLNGLLDAHYALEEIDLFRASLGNRNSK